MFILRSVVVFVLFYRFCPSLCRHIMNLEDVIIYANGNDSHISLICTHFSMQNVWYMYVNEY